MIRLLVQSVKVQMLREFTKENTTAREAAVLEAAQAVVEDVTKSIMPGV